MPPVDTNEPAQAPAPQQPKKLSFWAKLLGKKEAPAVPVAQPTSLTPEPQLDNPAPQDFGSAPSPVVGNDVTPPVAEVPADVPQTPVAEPVSDVVAPEAAPAPSVAEPVEAEAPAPVIEPVQPTAPVVEEPQTPPAPTSQQ